MTKSFKVRVCGETTVRDSVFTYTNKECIRKMLLYKANAVIDEFSEKGLKVNVEPAKACNGMIIVPNNWYGKSVLVYVQTYYADD